MFVSKFFKNYRGVFCKFIAGAFYKFYWRCRYEKIFGLTLMLLMIATNCFAMIFSQPKLIGGIGHYRDTYEGMPIGGESYNSGKPYPERNDEYNTAKTYYVGIARFGDGENALYCSYNWKDRCLKFGGKDNYVVTLDTKKIYPELILMKD